MQRTGCWINRTVSKSIHNLIKLYYYYSVSVYVGAGSRHEDLQTTGTSYLLQNLLSRGTSNRSKTELAEDIGNMGA